MKNVFLLTFVIFTHFVQKSFSNESIQSFEKEVVIKNDSTKKYQFILGGGILLAPINTQLSKPQINKNSIDFKAPLLITGTGVLLLSSSIKRAQTDWHQKTFNNTTFLIDDYLAFAPNVLAMGLGVVGVKAKHNFKERLLIATMANGIAMGITYGLKYTTQMKRPDNSADNSFPSGHTSFAFTGAQIIHEEYGHNSLIYSIAGYGIGAAVGSLRIINNKHWLADVVTGAGIGMVSTKLAYKLLPWAQKKIFKKDNIAALPIYLPKGAGVSLAIGF